MTTRIPRIDFFAPTGLPFTAHRDEADDKGSSFARRLQGTSAEGAQVAAAFWQRLPSGGWVPAPEGTFRDAAPQWDPATAVATVTVGFPVEGEPPAPGEWGVKIVVTLSDGRVLVADHPILISGAMS